MGNVLLAIEKDCRKHKARMAGDVGMKRSGMETERHEPVLAIQSGAALGGGLPLPLKPIIPFPHKSSIYQYFTALFLGLSKIPFPFPLSHFPFRKKLYF